MIVDDYVRLFDRKKPIKLVNNIYSLNEKDIFLFLVTLRVSDSPYNYNDTLYVHLYIDLVPTWIQRLVDWMNISTRTYHSQLHYFQSIEFLNIRKFEYFL